MTFTSSTTNATFKKATARKALNAKTLNKSTKSRKQSMGTFQCRNGKTFKSCKIVKPKKPMVYPAMTVSDGSLKRKADCDAAVFVDEYSRPTKKVKVDDDKKRLRFHTIAKSVHRVSDTYDLEKYHEYNSDKSFTGRQIKGFMRDVGFVQALWEHGRRQKAYDVSYTQINRGKACDVTVKNAQRRTKWTIKDTHLGDDSIFLRSNLLFEYVQMGMEMLEKETSPMVWKKVGKHWVHDVLQKPSKSSSPAVKKPSAPLFLQNAPFYASYKTKKDFKIVPKELLVPMPAMESAAPNTAHVLSAVNMPCFDQYNSALPSEPQALNDDEEDEIISVGSDDEGEVVDPSSSPALSILTDVDDNLVDWLGTQWVNGVRRSARHQPKMGSVYVNGLRRSARRLVTC
jgi:hypothetical protein